MQAAIRVAKICLMERLPIPNWAAPLVMEVLGKFRDGEFKRGHGVPSPAKASKSASYEIFIRNEVDRLIALGCEPHEAFDRLSQECKTLAPYGRKPSSPAIKTLYYRWNGRGGLR